jgi:hypothetical protein
MTGEKIFEDIVVHANICLKRWAEKGNGWDYQQVRSMILSWLNKAYLRIYSNYSNWKERTAVSKNLSNYMFFTFDPSKLYITSITVKSPTDYKDLSFPQLDYEELHKRSLQIMANTPALTEVKQLELKEVQSIKFN